MDARTARYAKHRQRRMERMKKENNSEEQEEPPERPPELPPEQNSSDKGAAPAAEADKKGKNRSKQSKTEKDAAPPASDSSLTLEVGTLDRAYSNPKSKISRFNQDLRLATVRLLNEAVAVSIETEEAVTRTEQLLHATENIAEDTQESMRQQHEQLLEIDETVAQFPSQFERAGFEIRKMFIQLKKDKIFVALCIAVTSCLGILAYIQIRKWKG